MTRSIELEAFLNNLSALGEHDSSGVFRVMADKGLEKLAEFNFPTPGAWCVKVVQAAVRGGFTPSIEVKLGRTSCHFSWALPRAWTAQRVAEALFHAESQDGGLEHLIPALRNLAVHQRRAFRLQLSNHLLAWDGEELSVTPSRNGRKQLTLEVEHLGLEERASGWLAGSRTRAERCAEIHQGLTERCYTCPYPLHLDGRRLDALQFAPKHGWGPNSSLLFLDFSQDESKLPLWDLPLGTFQQLDKSYRRRFSKGRPRSVQQDQEPRSQTSASVALLLSDNAPVTYQNFSYLPNRRSSCYWVLDGAVIEEHPILDAVSVCTLGIYVSAQGMPLDLTGFGVTVGDAKAEREKEALRQARNLLGNRPVWYAAPRPPSAPMVQPKPGERLKLGFAGAVSVASGILVKGSLLASVGGVAMGAFFLYTGCLKLDSSALPQGVAERRYQKKQEVWEAITREVDALLQHLSIVV